MVKKMDRAAKKELQIIIDAILNMVKAKTIYLFGSYARETASEDSDFDVYV